MFHSGTEKLIATWAALPEADRIPSRASLDPQTIADLLPQVFLAERGETGLVFRLAGAWVERLHGGSLRGRHWLPLWDRPSRLAAHRAAARAYREARPVVIAAEAGVTGERMEMVLAPLRGPSGAADRLLGLYQPTSLAGVGLKDIAEMALVEVRAAETVPGRAALSLAAIDGRLIA